MGDSELCFAEMVVRVLYEARNAGSTGAARTRARQLLNEFYRDLCAKHEFPELMREFVVTLTTTAQSDATWPLLIVTAPSDIQHIKDCEIVNDDGNTAAYTHPEILSHLEFLRKTRSANRSATTGRPKYIATRRIEGLRQDLQGATGAVTFLSTNVADTSAVGDVAVSGYLDTTRRRRVRASGDMNGTTAVTLHSAMFTAEYAAKDADTTGEIIISHGANEIGRIMPNERSAKYHIFELWTFPDIQYKARIEYKLIPPWMVSDADVPWYLPGALHTVLIDRAVARLLQAQEDSDWAGVEARADAAEQNYFVNHRPDLYATPRVKLVR